MNNYENEECVNVVTSSSVKDRVLALSEVIIVRFVVYGLIALGLMQLIYGTFNPDPFPLEASYFVGSLWFIIPAIMIFGLCRKAKDYGLTFELSAQSVDLSLSAFLLFVLTNVGFVLTLMMGWSYLEPLGALFLTAFFGASLILIVRLIERRYSNFQNLQIPNRQHQKNVFVLILLLLLPIILSLGLNKLSIFLVSTVIWQFVFSGFGEELFFRGYIQSRLNIAFGRPYEWRGIQFGAGLFITAGIFAVTHMLNTANIWGGDFNLAWWWGSFTFVGGILFGLLREKTGSIIASGTLHGLEAVGEGLALLF
ncbi:CPBP family intramembrane metalloprotease [Candidatus Thorarchaeota archaeon]|nr:MAG: CPBP family intramembrane metalloprotease [Candidatus Thorarchaeota archaeon]